MYSVGSRCHFHVIVELTIGFGFPNAGSAIPREPFQGNCNACTLDEEGAASQRHSPGPRRPGSGHEPRCRRGVGRRRRHVRHCADEVHGLPRRFGRQDHHRDEPRRRHRGARLGPFQPGPSRRPGRRRRRSRHRRSDRHLDRHCDDLRSDPFREGDLAYGSVQHSLTSR